MTLCQKINNDRTIQYLKSVFTPYKQHETIRENKKTLLINLHKSIEESSNTTANNVFHGRINQLINYPPNGGLTENEIKAIEELKGKEDLKSVLRKLFASTTSDVFFDFFNVLDGHFRSGSWNWRMV